MLKAVHLANDKDEHSPILIKWILLVAGGPFGGVASDATVWMNP